MLKLILDMDFEMTPPAVDRSDFACHGHIAKAVVAPGRSPPGKALDFADPDAAVRIALRPAWTNPVALAIEAWIMLRSHGDRCNIIEGDGSFAFFVDPDGGLVGSLFATVEGAGSPSWQRVSSTSNSPDGVSRIVPLGRWCKVTFLHDGVTSLRLFLDGQLAARRADYVSGIPSVGPAGVVIGNWTLSSKFPFDGLIDQVRVWKHDENAIVKDFAARPMSPEARDQWDAMIDCIRRQLGPHGRELLYRIERQWAHLIRLLFRALQDGPDCEREAFRCALATYRHHWRAGSIEHPEHARALMIIREIAGRTAGDGWIAELEALARSLVQGLEQAMTCIDADLLAKLDPAFRGFIDRAAARASGKTAS